MQGELRTPPDVGLPPVSHRPLCRPAASAVSSGDVHSGGGRGHHLLGQHVRGSHWNTETQVGGMALLLS